MNLVATEPTVLAWMMGRYISKTFISLDVSFNCQSKLSKLLQQINNALSSLEVNRVVKEDEGTKHQNICERRSLRNELYMFYVTVILAMQLRLRS